jgi:hypothetical protein
MATRNSKKDEKELAEAKNISSPNYIGNLVLEINYLYPPDEENGTYSGQDLWLKAQLGNKEQGDYIFKWTIDKGEFKGSRSLTAEGNPVCIVTNAVEDNINVRVTVQLKGRAPIETKKGFAMRQPTISDLKGNFDSKMDDLREGITGGLSVNFQRTSVPTTDDIALWVVIRNSTKDLSFANYNRFMDKALSADLSAEEKEGTNATFTTLLASRSLPFNDMDAYRLLKVATEAFVLVSSGVNRFSTDFEFLEEDVSALNQRLGGAGLNLKSIQDFWKAYLKEANGAEDPMLPYLAIIRNKLRNDELSSLMILREEEVGTAGGLLKCINALRNKRTDPFLFELIWSYWQEEGMLVQTMNAIARRFQNIRSPRGARDPLAGLEIDTLRPLSNLLWGYVQDEQHRLTIARRDSEYDHQYGMSLKGRAVPRLRSADPRKRFSDALNVLLNLASTFFKQDDDTTVIADGFPLLNALKEVHLVLSQGAHNQFGDLPSTARQEMLIQQYILARPEFREFLPTRNAVAYPETWMDRVEAMKHLQGWNDTSIIHFHNLAVFGEQILLGIRYGAWSGVNLPAQAANWARFWRAEIQGYIHAYRAVTGVDLSSGSSNRIDSAPPSVHLYNRSMRQGRRV